MCDIDPPPDDFYNPEYPLESDDEFGCIADPLSVSVPSTGRNLGQVSELDTVSDDHDRNTDKQPSPSPAPTIKVYQDLFCAKTYKKEDLYPTEMDLSCFPAWTLSPYWPVYLSNFRLNSLEESERHLQISTYFASKGLLCRMIFIWENFDKHYFNGYQRKSLLLDMLVYFTSKEDADRAIRCCDKTTYYGHKLNVFPGRIPIYFDPERTICFKIGTHAVHLTETIAEHRFRYRGIKGIETVVRKSETELFVEFCDQHAMNKAVMKSPRWIPMRLHGPVQKQRYLEQDCKYEMMFFIQENPSFLDMVPAENILKDMLNGKLPAVLRDWDDWTEPKPLPASVLESIENNKRKRKMHLIENASIKLEAKKNGVNVAKKPETGSFKRYKKEVIRQKKAFLGIKEEQNKSSVMEFASQRYLVLLREFIVTRSELESKKDITTLSERNKLFYDLLRTEREMYKLLKVNPALSCELLENGLIVSMVVAGENTDFPKYPTQLALSDELEPLDKLWPVFVGNFPVTDLDAKSRNMEIHDFFAIKNFSVQMIYLKEDDKFYNSYLKVIQLLDMLVYFHSEEVAQQVVKTYHGTMHRGSKLTAYNGRKHLCFLTGLTAYIKLDKDPVVAEQSIERVLVNISPESLHSLNRFPKRAYFSFRKTYQIRAAMSSGLPLIRFWKQKPKQRYIEKDVKQKLLRRLLTDADFLNNQPRANTLRSLFVAASLPTEENGEIVWAGGYQQRKVMNERIGNVLAEWEKLQ
ncbi:uncharacterized protein LOC134222834 [Armigeres subalbatus]|uniref:uncharacterized protein LOC134222834 n=1 Tax=Armigeres subalbatus TaxID=124917 RepID=UPI002ED25FA3